MSEENVLVVSVGEAAVPQVLEVLSQLDSEGGIGLRAAVVVHRSLDGRISIEDHVGDMETRQTVVERHPRLAVLLTVLAGPLDMLLGNSLVAVAEPRPDELALEHVAWAIPLGGTAVIADVVERDFAVVSHGLAHLECRVVRRRLADVQAEIGAVDEAIGAAGTEARRVLRGTRPTPH